MPYKVESNNKESDEIPDRRVATLPIMEPDDTGTFSLGIAWFDKLIRAFKLEDILSARGHSEDFRDTRAEYINDRLRIILIFYAAGVLFWTIMDYFVVQPEFHIQILEINLFYLALLISLVFYTWMNHTLNHVSSILSLTVFGILLFYGVKIWILSSHVDNPEMTNYQVILQLLMVAIGLFPLTVFYGLFLVLMVLTAFVLMAHCLGALYSFDTLQGFQKLLLFAGLSLWIQSGQLLMLLQLYRESTHDMLTGLVNRRALTRRLDAEIRRAGSGGYTFSILMFDLDRFKQVNDKYGHHTGDQVLKRAAHVLSTNLRQSEILARYGGEEFIAVLPGVGGDTAMTVAERLRQVLENTVEITPRGDKIHLRSSIGVTEYRQSETLDEVIQRADELLYHAKEQGRNRVSFSFGNDEQAFSVIT